MVDVLIVSYNHAAFLKECLNSWAQQTHPGFRLWIVDDASTDRSAEVIQNWALAHPQLSIRLFLNSLNKGLLKNLNEIIPRMDGDFIKIIAADDFVDPDFLKKNLDAAEQNPEAEVFFSRAAIVDAASRILPDKTYYLRDYSKVTDFQALFMKENVAAAPSLFFRQQLYNRIGLYDESTLLEDYELLLKSLHHQVKFHFIPETLTFYRSHDQNATKTRRERIHKETLLLKMRYAPKGKFSSEINRTALFIHQQYGLTPVLLQMLRQHHFSGNVLGKLMQWNLPTFFLKLVAAIF